MYEWSCIRISNNATYSQHVLQRWLQQVPELLLRDELKERWFERITTNIVEKFHQPLNSIGVGLVDGRINMAVMKKVSRAGDRLGRAERALSPAGASSLPVASGTVYSHGTVVYTEHLTKAT